MINLIYGWILGVLSVGTPAYILFKNPEIVEKWLGMFFDCVSKFWKGAERFATKNQIQGSLNSFIKKIENKTNISLPRASIKFANVKKEEIFWEEGAVIIVMRDRKQKNKNLVHAVYFFTSKILLKKIKRHLGKKYKESLDLFTTKKILETESKSALEQFMEDYLIPSIDANQDIMTLIKQFSVIDEIGIFFPILIQELSYLGNKVFWEKLDPDIVNEVESLIKFLEKFAERELGSISEELFIGKYTRCAIKIIASRMVREKGELEGSKKRILSAIKKGAESVYIIGSDSEENKEFMKDVSFAAMSADENIKCVKEYSFPGKIKKGGESFSVKTYLICLQNPKEKKYFYNKEDIEKMRNIFELK